MQTEWKYIKQFVIIVYVYVLCGDVFSLFIQNTDKVSLII